MIVDTMTLIEASEHVFKTVKKRFKRILFETQARNESYKKAVKASREGKCLFKPIVIKVDNIDIYVGNFTKGKDDYKKYGVLSIIYGKFVHRRSTYYFMILSDLSNMVLFTKHFFERYMERHLYAEPSGLSIEIVRQFLMETDGCLINERLVQNEEHKDGIHGAVNIGVCCGYILDDRVAVWNTFIDNSTITKGEKKVSVEQFKKSCTTIFVDINGREVLLSTFLEQYNNRYAC